MLFYLTSLLLLSFFLIITNKLITKTDIAITVINIDRYNPSLLELMCLFDKLLTIVVVDSFFE